MNKLSETGRDVAQSATDAAKDVTGVVKGAAGDVTHATKDAVNHATDTAKDLYESAELKAEDALATSKEYVRRNPVPVVLGAFAVGVTIGYMLTTARR